ncbi:NAD-dependent epimerase/dehydratase family protein [Sphingobacterium sp. DN00404]|uniref:NAD-dependent epimerase/dehydratase family protein n=1 Tax=Sphingobacterium micropteri TaxID=2763501 RepID=A0ABR7YKN7_9SPHI|nr:NAD-dependent epimerase/dehydratase family protein [Sphingobacterium micropteri]MBD1431824.1 NAD-dependent epimerase/dehydratase family protein [Sphingobacterium micropteri]
MTIIITGASGFVGQNLQKYLIGRQYDVKRLSLRNDLWQTHVDQDAAAIVHLAGKAHDTTNTSSEQEYFKVNRDLTIELFKLFLKSNIRDFFYFSSVKAVADTVEGVLKEDVQSSPYTPYGKSKLEAEQYLLAQALPKDKRLFIIRPCMIHGPGNKGNLNLLYNVVEKGIPWPLAAFHNERSFLSIDNLSYLIEQMLVNQQLQSGVYNFADDDALSTNELVTLISEVLGKNPKLWSIPTGVIKGVVKMGDVLPLPLNSERLKKLTESYMVSNKKIKQILGIDKLPLTAKEGLEKTIKSFIRS